MQKSSPGALRRMSRTLLESLIGRVARDSLFKQTARREQRAVDLVRGFSRSYSSLFVEAADFTHLRARAAFFILGNGATVNSLSKSDFSVMDEGFSVGLNGWPLHPYLPNVYSFEFGNDAEPVDDQLRTLVARALSKADRHPTPVMFLRPSSRKLPHVATWLESLDARRLWFYGRANLVTRRAENVERDLRVALRYLARGKRDSVLLDNGASVVRMISLALLSGFKEIVLAGVDLNHSQYFWFDEDFIERHGDFRQSYPRAASDSQLTLSTENRPFSTYEVICALATVAETDYRAQIFVAREGQALSADLPTYRFV